MIDRLISEIDKKNNPTVVGLDPKLDMIPQWILETAAQECGSGLKAAARAIFLFNKAIIDEVYDLVPAVKAQVAMYEMFGSHGIAAYIETLCYAKEKGLVTIGDVKRNDIASTAEAYALGHLGQVSFNGQGCHVYHEDFITVNPYLGVDGIEPFTKCCKENDRGIFVLVKTSNKSSGDIQDLLLQNNEPVYLHVGKLVSSWGEKLIGKSGYSDVCAVVGATYPQQAEVLRQALPHTFFLIPGYGAQGGKAADLKPYFDKNGSGGIVNNSRGIIAAYTLPKYKDFSPENFALAAKQAVLDMKEDINGVR